MSVPEGLADDTQRADLLAGPCAAAALSHSLVAELAGCVHVTLRDQMLPVSPIFGLQRREVRVFNSVLSSLFEVRPNDRSPNLITSSCPSWSPQTWQ